MTTSLHEPKPSTTTAPPRVDVHWGTDSVGRSVGDLWAQRSLLPRIGIRVMIKGLAGTMLGPFWIVVAPIVSLIGFGFLFGSIAKPPSHGVPYLVFMLAGALGWSAFERVAFWGTRSFDVYRRILRNVQIPGLMVPIAGSVIASVEVAMSLVILFGTLIVYWVVDGTMYLRISPQLLLVPVGLVLSVLVGWSVAFWTGTLNARARDVRLVFRWVLLIWLYITPVLYPLSSLPGPVAAVAQFNPVVAPVEMVKEGFLHVGSVELDRLGVTLAFIVIAGGAGAWFCTHMSPRFVRLRMGLLDDDEDDF
jgi:lipopolysaccharide transport system permease protein